MKAFATRLFVFVATAYLATLAVLFVFQSSFIYPAPQETHDPAPGFEAVALTTSDGLELTAHWRAPEASKPVVVWFHGNGGSLAASTDETELLATQGYGVLLAPYRGYGGNPGDPSEEGFYRDGRSAMQFLADQGITPEQTIIGGNSIGSGTAAQMTVEFSPAALILVSPFTSVPDVAANSFPMFPVRMLLQHEFDNIGKLPALDLPMLIMHGDADRMVPFEHGQRLAESNPRAEFIAFEGVGHDLTFRQEAKIAHAEWLLDQGL